MHVFAVLVLTRTNRFPLSAPMELNLQKLIDGCERFISLARSVMASRSGSAPDQQTVDRLYESLAEIREDSAVLVLARPLGL
jgi:hypothetical protein